MGIGQYPAVQNANYDRNFLLKITNRLGFRRLANYKMKVASNF